MRVFDWTKAAKIIAERKPRAAEAGLGEDWFWTGAGIYQDGQPLLDSAPFLRSSWATPTLVLYIGEDEIHVDCWKDGDGDPGVWPKEAVDALAER